jgi:TonB family protein
MRFVLAILVSACTASAAVATMRAQEATTVYAPGNGVSLPVLVKQVGPHYTSEALRRKITGTVLLEAVVLSNGTVGDVTVIRSLDPYYGLDEHAFKAMKEWQFKPGLKDGRAVAVRVQVEMTFALAK